MKECNALYCLHSTEPATLDTVLPLSLGSSYYHQLIPPDFNENVQTLRYHKKENSIKKMCVIPLNL